MKIFVSAQGNELESPASEIFGRAPLYVCVESDTMKAESYANPAIKAQSGAGIEAAQWLIDHGAQAVISANIGPKALRVFKEAGIPVYHGQKGSVRENIELWKLGKLQQLNQASTAAHSGI